MTRQLAAAALAVAVGLMTPAGLRGQSPSPAVAVAPAGEVLGVGNFLHLVADLDKSFAFYRELLGVENATLRPYALNERVANLYGMPGAQNRGITVRVPGTDMGCELQDWKVDRHPVRPRVQDPGATILVLRVRDIDAAMAIVRKIGAPILTPGGAPASLPGGDRAVLLDDPDGFHVELVQRPVPPASSAPATSNILNAAFRVTVADVDKTTKFYREALGFEIGEARAVPDITWAQLAGIKDTQSRIASSMVPGSSTDVQFVEFKSVDRKPVKATVRDPGVSMLRVRVRDMDSMLKALKAGGATVSSANGQAVTAENGQKSVIVSDLNNVFLQPVQPAPAASVTKH